MIFYSLHRRYIDYAFAFLRFALAPPSRKAMAGGLDFGRCRPAVAEALARQAGRIRSSALYSGTEEEEFQRRRADPRPDSFAERRVPTAAELA